VINIYFSIGTSTDSQQLIIDHRRHHQQYLQQLQQRQYNNNYAIPTTTSTAATVGSAGAFSPTTAAGSAANHDPNLMHPVIAHQMAILKQHQFRQYQLFMMNNRSPPQTRSSPSSSSPLPLNFQLKHLFLCFDYDGRELEDGVKTSGNIDGGEFTKKIYLR
jgi:hypothetical protein